VLVGRVDEPAVEREVVAAAALAVLVDQREDLLLDRRVRAVRDVGRGDVLLRRGDQAAGGALRGSG
jgi:CRP-like cAMP-binding protein